MKQLKKILTILLIAAICISTGGCTMFDVFSVDSLIRAPKITGANAEIQQCFESAVGKEVSLLSPVAGEYRSSFVFFDFDKDGKEEVIVFYYEKDVPDVARLHFLDSQNDKWYSVTDIKGSGSEVYSVEFTDMDNVGTYELAVAWTVSDSKRTKTLSIYKFGQNDVTGENMFLSLATVQVSDYMFIDMDYDSSNELFYTLINTTDNKPVVSAKLLKLSSDSDELFPVSELPLNPDIISFNSYLYDANNGNSRIYIDCELSGEKYYTEIICFDYENSAFYFPTDKDGNNLSASTVRYSQLITEDLKNDSTIEIPHQYDYEDSYVINAPEGTIDKVYITEYLRFTDKELVPVVKYFVNETFSYRIIVDGLIDTMYIVYDNTTGAVQFRVKDLSESENLAFSLQYRTNDADVIKSFNVNITKLGESMNLNRSVITNLIEVI